MEILKKELDFIGIALYTSHSIQDCIYSSCGPGMGVIKTEEFYQQSSIEEDFTMSIMPHRGLLNYQQFGITVHCKASGNQIRDNNILHNTSNTRVSTIFALLLYAKHTE
ncbi:hypothetical protein Dsin_027887 [Dipteronia sinensis]|uniref:Uncharacterized protein n=1 Tax=Dipteronia sinensis TaxID=43782 RepID=A0AAD9ZQZ7_9ROSI|nr:hypothetical protein Dsin_027887 [Dipteronia sinensis]